MPCFKPFRAYYGKTVNEKTGKRPIVFHPREAEASAHHGLMLPCGKCQGCLLERSRVWAFRCMQEASLYEDNCFITLTFDDAHLDKDGSLRKDDFPRFMKRLRSWVCRHEWSVKERRYVERAWRSQRVRFYHCGEYGERFRRPHHHALIFGFDFQDKQFWSKRGEVVLYTSNALSNLWDDGFSSVGAVTFESAAYVARYVMKKLVQEDAPQFYAGKVPEHVSMSRNKGIGCEWFKRYHADVFPGDSLIIRDGVKCKPPRYYGSIYELTEPEKYAAVVHARQAAARERPLEAARMAAKWTIMRRRIGMLKRQLA